MEKQKNSVSSVGSVVRVLSWGFGTQSTYLAAAAALGQLPWRYDLVVGADLGWESAETYAIAQFYREMMLDRGVEVVILRTGDIRHEGAMAHVHIPFWTESGAPLQRQCTREFKIRPIRRFVREWLGYPASHPPHPPPGAVEQHLGISLDEYQRMKTSDVAYTVNRYPLCTDLRMTRQDCIAWYGDMGLPVPPKSACIGCPYRSAEEWLHLQENFPEEFADACAFDDENRENPLADRGSSADRLFVWRDLLPLAEVDFQARVENEDLPLFCESGYCHV